MSSVTEDGEDGLLINYDTSKGSSVSSGLQVPWYIDGLPLGRLYILAIPTALLTLN